MNASFQTSPSFTKNDWFHNGPSFCPSQVPVATPLLVRMATVGVILVALPSVTATLLISHVVPVQAFSVSAFPFDTLPITSTNVISFVTIVPSLAASLAIQASQPDFSRAIRASVKASPVEGGGA